MGITKLFVNRPTLVTVVLAAIALAGAVSYATLVNQQFPNIDFPDDPSTRQLSGRLADRNSRCDRPAARRRNRRRTEPGPPDVDDPERPGIDRRDVYAELRQDDGFSRSAAPRSVGRRQLAQRFGDAQHRQLRSGRADRRDADGNVAFADARGALPAGEQRNRPRSRAGRRHRQRERERRADAGDRSLRRSGAPRNLGNDAGRRRLGDHDQQRARSGRHRLQVQPRNQRRRTRRRERREQRRQSLHSTDGRRHGRSGAQRRTLRHRKADGYTAVERRNARQSFSGRPQ